MNLSDQLSLIETKNIAKDVDVKHKAYPASKFAEEQTFPENAHSFGNQSYADLKGRPSISKVAQTENYNVPSALKKYVPVPSGYIAPSTEDEKYLSVKEVAHRYSVSVPTIWRWAKEDEAFPKQHVIRPGTSRWRIKDLVAFENRDLEA